MSKIDIYTLKVSDKAKLCFSKILDLTSGGRTEFYASNARLGALVWPHDKPETSRRKAMAGVKELAEAGCLALRVGHRKGCGALVYNVVTDGKQANRIHQHTGVMDNGNIHQHTGVIEHAPRCHESRNEGVIGSDTIYKYNYNNREEDRSVHTLPPSPVSIKTPEGFQEHPPEQASHNRPNPPVLPSSPHRPVQCAQPVGIHAKNGLNGGCIDTADLVTRALRKIETDTPDGITFDRSLVERKLEQYARTEPLLVAYALTKYMRTDSEELSAARKYGYRTERQLDVLFGKTRESSDYRRKHARWIV